MSNEGVQAVINSLIPILTTYGLRILGAIAILVAGRILAGVLANVTRRALIRSKIDESLVGFAASLVKGGIIVFAVIAALSNFGIETASFIAVIGAAGLAVGLALQGALSNFAAGVLILLFRPFRIGDVIESAGSRGKVREIGILATTLTTPDNQLVILPNGALMTPRSSM